MSNKKPANNKKLWIHLSGLEANAIIGVYPDERREKQKLTINIKLLVNIDNAVKSDDIKDTLNYADFAKKTIKKIENSQYQLLESLHQDLECYSLKHSLVSKAEISISKPQALAQIGIAGLVSVVSANDEKS